MRLNSILCSLYFSALTLSKQLRTKTSMKIVFDDFFSDWRSISEIFSAIDSVGDELKEENFGKSFSVGVSSEKQKLKVIQISKSANPAATKSIVIMGAMHGREWGAGTSVLYSAWKTLSNIKKKIPNDVFTQRLLSGELNVYFLPVLNPDGYSFSYNAMLKGAPTNSSSRLWRKNRRNLCSRGHKGSSKCAHGIDLNRNFGVPGVSWGFGSSKPTTEVFQGRRPFSEPENKALVSWLDSIRSKNSVNGFLDVHCCSQAVLQPFNYKEKNEKKFEKERKGCEKLARDMNVEENGNKEYVCRARETEFSESNTGVAVDYISNELGIENSFIVETRGNRKSRKMDEIFEVDKEDIIPIGEEVYAAIVSLVEIIFTETNIRQDEILAPVKEDIKFFREILPVATESSHEEHDSIELEDELLNLLEEVEEQQKHRESEILSLVETFEETKLTSVKKDLAVSEDTARIETAPEAYQTEDFVDFIVKEKKSELNSDQRIVIASDDASASPMFEFVSEKNKAERWPLILLGSISSCCFVLYLIRWRLSIYLQRACGTKRVD
eukprot:maker-scaffold_3-snap-gene-17.1-mRNA-1 protein AED:0.11 eAED:0.11 QI:320/1/1/1/1/1/3/77/552